MHLVYFPKFCIAIAFDFSWNDWNTQEKLETMFMQFFFFGGGGGGGGGLTRCNMVYMKMVNSTPLETKKT